MTVKRCFCMLLTMLVVISINSFVFAADQSLTETDVPVDGYQYAKAGTASLRISSNGVATLVTKIDGKSKTTKLAVLAILQKYNRGVWSKVDSWNYSTKSNYLYMQKNININKGTYRVYAIFHAYDGKSSELIDAFSNSVKY